MGRAHQFFATPFATSLQRGSLIRCPTEPPFQTAASSAQVRPQRWMVFVDGENLAIRAKDAAASDQFQLIDWDKNQLVIRLTVYPRFRTLQQADVPTVCGSIVQQAKALLDAKVPRPFIDGLRAAAASAVVPHTCGV